MAVASGIVRGIRSIFPGFGNPGEYVSLLNQQAAINATTAFALTGFVNWVSSGIIRLRTIGIGVGAAQVTGLKITATDGTDTETLYQDAIARTASEFHNMLFHFVSELKFTTITVSVTLANVANGTYNYDIEVAGNS